MPELPLLMLKRDLLKLKSIFQLLKINLLLLKITKEKLTKILELLKQQETLLKMNIKELSEIWKTPEVTSKPPKEEKN